MQSYIFFVLFIVLSGQFRKHVLLYRHRITKAQNLLMLINLDQNVIRLKLSQKIRSRDVGNFIELTVIFESEQELFVVVDY